MKKLILVGIISILIIFLPAVLFLVFAQEYGEVSFHLSVTKKTTHGDGIFNFEMEKMEAFVSGIENFNQVFASELAANSKIKFSIATKSGIGSYEDDYKTNGYGFFGIKIKELESEGWEIKNIVCRGAGDFFDYKVLGSIVELYGINDGNHVECEFTNEGQTSDKFVYVALGDSYQSGEGAGNSIQNTSDYLNVYENGKNYEHPDKSKYNTYTAGVSYGDVPTGGDGCHRALDNYAKINRDKLKPGTETVLIDQTCSGAKIEPGIGNSIIVGKTGNSEIDANSQIARAITQLNAIGLSPEDVDLVTVGMGGNDAKFSEIISACFMPNVVRKMLEIHPNAPAEIKFLADQFATCENFDKLIFKSDEAINNLKEKEVWAQRQTLSIFGNARVMQVNYPNILPDKKTAPAWCGGFRKDDLDYARNRIKKINEKIAEAAQASDLGNSRLEIVNLEKSFGNNALCASNSEATLANGINQKNFDSEVKRLLNIGSDGDSVSRGLIDQIIAEYKNWKSCLPNPFCNATEIMSQVKIKGNKLIKYLTEKKQFEAIMANLAVAPEIENQSVKFDRSIGLFHPNGKGQEVMACKINAAFNGIGSGACLPVIVPATNDTIMGVPVGNAPINGSKGIKLKLYFGGFAPNTPVVLRFFSAPVELGTVNSDNNGIVDTVVTLPEAQPGVHTIILEGVAAGETGIAKQFRIKYPGDPRGDGSYGIYFTGFIPNDGENESEKVDIIYGDRVFVTLTPDEDGGIFVELPLFGQQGLVKVSAKSQVTGKVVEENIKILGGVDLIISDVKEYIASGLITGTEKFTLPNALDYLRYQFSRLDNAKISCLSNSRKNYLIPIYVAAINKKIDDIAAIIESGSGKTIDRETAQVLIGSLVVLKID